MDNIHIILCILLFALTEISHQQTPEDKCTKDQQQVCYSCTKIGTCSGSPGAFTVTETSNCPANQYCDDTINDTPGTCSPYVAEEDIPCLGCNGNCMSDTNNLHVLVTCNPRSEMTCNGSTSFVDSVQCVCTATTPPSPSPSSSSSSSPTSSSSTPSSPTSSSSTPSSPTSSPSSPSSPTSSPSDPSSPTSSPSDTSSPTSSPSDTSSPTSSPSGPSSPTSSPSGPSSPTSSPSSPSSPTSAPSDTSSPTSSSSSSSSSPSISSTSAPPKCTETCPYRDDVTDPCQKFFFCDQTGVDLPATCPGVLCFNQTACKCQ